MQLFTGLARDRDDVDFADLCNKQGLLLRQNIEAHAWDGDWYRCAYLDDGVVIDQAAVSASERMQAMIPLLDDHGQHDVEVLL